MSELEPVGAATAVEYSHSGPALLFGSDPRRRRRAETALAASGVRLVDSVPLTHAMERLDGQLSLGLAWLELGEEDAHPGLDGLLSRLNGLAEDRGTIVIASAPLELVDLLAGRLTGRSTEILVAPAAHGEGGQLVLVKELVQQSAGVVEHRQFNPDLTFRVERSVIVAVTRWSGSFFEAPRLSLPDRRTS